MSYFSIRKKIFRIILRFPIITPRMRVGILRKMGVTIGDNVNIAPNFYLSDKSTDNNLLTIGNNTDIASGVVIITTSGPVVAAIKKIYGEVSLPVTIGHDIWIGTNVIILPGVTIGEYSVIGAGCVIDKDIAPYSIVRTGATTIHKLPKLLINELCTSD